MNHEEHVVFVDRQKEISLKARDVVSKVVTSLDVKMILSDRAKARKRFISAMVRNTDRFLTESLRNGRELRKAKLG